MTLRTRAVRILSWTALSIAALVLLTAAAIQVQQHLLRRRAERLMADMHQVRLYQSTWADAQRLMHRWGAWGHYDGDCTSADCTYRITLSDLSRSTKETWTAQLIEHETTARIYSAFGGRATRLSVSFTIQDGKILREEAALSVTASPPLFQKSDVFQRTLTVLTKSRQRVRATTDDWWVLGNDEQLAEHPFYKAGRPGGCEINCEEAVVTYSTHTPPAEVERLTNFDLSCITRLSSCTELEQILPASKAWRLYDDGSAQIQADARTGCAIPLWAIARDARYALEAEGLSSRSKEQRTTIWNPTTNTFEKTSILIEEARVRIQSVLKGDPPWAVDDTVTSYPFPGNASPSGSPVGAEHIIPGKRYLVFPIGDDRKDQRLSKESALSLNACGVWEDTLANRIELQRGLAMNDDLRGPERW